MFRVRRRRPTARARVFVVAADAARERHDGAGNAGPQRWAELADSGGDADGLTLPTPAARDLGQHRPFVRAPFDSVRRVSCVTWASTSRTPPPSARWERCDGPASSPPKSPDGLRLSRHSSRWMWVFPTGGCTTPAGSRSAAGASRNSSPWPCRAAAAAVRLRCRQGRRGRMTCADPPNPRRARGYCDTHYRRVP